MTVATLSAKTKRTPIKDLPSSFPSIISPDTEKELDVDSISKDFLHTLSTANSTQDWSLFGSLFNDISWWKDCLTLTFDKRTLHGSEQIVNAWKALYKARRPSKFSLDTASSGIDLGKAKFERLAPTLAYIEVPFSFITLDPASICVGVAKLTTSPDDPHSWKVWVLTTGIVSLKQSPFDPLPKTRQNDYIDPTQRGRSSAQGLPRLTQEGQPLDAIVIGGNSSGLANGIELESIGCRSFILDKEIKAGGSWSGRYDNITLHHPAFMIQLPKFPVPDKGYPKFLSGRDLERYYSAAIEKLNLPFFAGIQVISNHFDSVTQLWTVTLKDVQSNQETTLQTKNLVISNGFLISKENVHVPRLENRDVFKGVIQHSSQVTTSDLYSGKEVVIVGSGNSAHDIANILCTGDVDKRAKSVTILQRSPTVMFDFDVIGPVVTSKYQGNLPIDTADFLQESLPLGINRDMAKGGIAMLLQSQVELNKKLEEKGYLLDKEPCLMSRAFEERGRAFYMDHLGTFDLVLQDKIKIVKGTAAGFEEGGLVIKELDGATRTLRSDAVILATGYETIDLPKKWAEDGFLDKQSASMIENVSIAGVDAEGEMPGYVTNSGHPNLYFSGIGLYMARWIARYTSIQVKADVTGTTPQRLARV